MGGGQGECAVARTWDGEEVGEVARVRWWTTMDGEGVVEIEARDFGDPAPEERPGRHPRLWEHEVVEVFFAEAPTREARYWELEVGPHGHWLALGFERYRERMALEPEVEVITERFERDGEKHWRGRVRVPGAWVRCGFVNAYVIHGKGGERRYLAAHPAPRECSAPDFHRLEHFGAYGPTEYEAS
jgi:hypothetical protein